MKVWRKVKMEIKNYEVGDQITVKLSGYGKFTATAQRICKDGTPLFMFDSCVTERPMNENGSNEGGFYASDLCKWMNTELIDAFPKKLKNLMLATDEKHSCLLRIPTRKEMFGEDEYSQDYETDLSEQFELMKDRKNRVCSFPHDEYAWYWLMNAHIWSSYHFACVGTGGGAGDIGASSSYGVRPTFYIENR